MALQFNPPEWLIREYMNRKRPQDEVADQLNKIVSDNQTYRQNQELLGLKKQEMAQKGVENTIDSAKIGYDPNNPGAYWEQYNADKQRQGKLTDSQIAENEAQAKYYSNKPNFPPGTTAKPQLRQNAFTGEWEWYQPPAPGGTPTPTTPGATPPPVATPGVAPHGVGTFRDRSKAAGAYAEESTMVDGVISEINRVKVLNKNSRGGVLGALAQKGQSALNMGTDSPEFKNTADVINTLKGAVSRVLKSTFGGQLSDSEREYLNQVYGAAERMSPSERDIAMTNVITILNGKKQASGAKLNALTGQGQPAPQTGGQETPEQRKARLIQELGGAQ